MTTTLTSVIIPSWKTGDDSSKYMNNMLYAVLLVFLIVVLLYSAAAAVTSAPRGKGRGRWLPGAIFIPLLIVRWLMYPHESWVKEMDRRHHYTTHHAASGVHFKEVESIGG